MKTFFRTIVVVAPWAVRVAWAALGLAFSMAVKLYKAAAADIHFLVEKWVDSAGRAGVLGQYFKALRISLTVAAWAGWIAGLIIIAHLIVWAFRLVF